MPTQLTPETVERIRKDAETIYVYATEDDLDKGVLKFANSIVDLRRDCYISGATTEALKSVEKDKEIERLRGLIEKMFKDSTKYLLATDGYNFELANTEIENGWNLYKKTNNI